MNTFSLDQMVHMMRMSGSGTFSSGHMGMMGGNVAPPWQGSSQSQGMNQTDAAPLGMGMGALTTPEQDFKVIKKPNE